MSFPLYHPDSAVIRLNQSTRVAHIPIIMPISYELENGTLKVEPWELFTSIGSFLAFKHFNDRSAAVLPRLPEILKGCDLQLTTSFYDSRFSPLEASRAFIEIIEGANHSLSRPDPMAITGCAYSSVTKTAGVLTGVYGVPLISPTASSPQLDRQSIYQMFARVIPTDESEAVIIVQYFRSLEIKNFGLIHVRDELGVHYAKFVREEAKDMRVTSVSFEKGNPTSMTAAILAMQESELKYFYAIAALDDEELLREARRVGIAGPGYSWVLADTGLHKMTFDADDPIIEAMHGIGFLTVDIAAADNLEQNLLSFQFDTELQEEFVSSMVS
jgi:hypothetical protein